MRLHVSTFSFLRRHAWAIVALMLLIAAYFAAIGWLGEKLRDDIGQSYRNVPSVEDRGHRPD